MNMFYYKNIHSHIAHIPPSLSLYNIDQQIRLIVVMVHMYLIIGHTLASMIGRHLLYSLWTCRVDFVGRIYLILGYILNNIIGSLV